MAGNDQQALLRDAIERNSAVVLSLPSAGLLRSHKSRFLADAGDAFWVESVLQERPLLDELAAAGRPVGLAFRSGTQKVVLAAPIRGRDANFRVNDAVAVEAIRLAFPDRVTSVQRRNHYRVRVAMAGGLSLRVWRIAERAVLDDVPVAAAEVAADVRDISLGGVGVTLTGSAGEPPKVSPADRLRLELAYRGAALVLEGRLRHPADPPRSDPCRAGVQFTSLEADLAGRQKLAQLAKLVGELHRDEVRRARGGN